MNFINLVPTLCVGAHASPFCGAKRGARCMTQTGGLA
jgi:hypothetical protein